MEDLDHNSIPTTLFYMQFTESKYVWRDWDHKSTDSTSTILFYMQFIDSNAIRTK